MITDSRRLSSVSAEIASRKANLARLREVLESKRAHLDECRMRMLIAETPQADLELHLASESERRVEAEVREAERQIEALLLEEHRLSTAVDES